MHSFVLLDRSGSMESRWQEALSSLNAYVDDLARNDATRDSLATLMVFDKNEHTEAPILRDAAQVSKWTPIGSGECAPRGYTPLFDAIGRITALAEANGGDKAVLVIITDGMENASSEVTRDGAKAAIDRLRTRGYQIVFLGADFDAFDQAAQVGVAMSATLNITGDNYKGASEALARRTTAYAATGAGFIGFTQDERNNALGKSEGK